MTIRHAVINSARGGRFECLRCGAFYVPELPAPAWVLASLASGFSKEHAGCEPHPEGDVCSYCGKRGHVTRTAHDCPENMRSKTPQEWRNGPDTGISSITIYDVMTTTASALPRYPPADPSDFGRCYRLLKLFPEWRARLDEMASVPGWSSLVANWGRLEAMYEEELESGKAPRLYAEMQKLSKEAT